MDISYYEFILFAPDRAETFGDLPEILGLEAFYE
jgi:hypothetical protein